MKSKKRIYIIAMLIASVFAIIGISIYFKGNVNKENNQTTISLSEAKEYVEKLTNIIINGGTKEELILTLQTDEVQDETIMTGADMYLRQTPSKNIIKKYSLDDYVSKEDALATSLEKHIQDNFEYKIDSTVENAEYHSINVTYKGFYYTSYIADLQRITYDLLIKSGYDLENVTGTEKFKVDMYKARIKAASLLDNYLDYYNNESEEKQTTVSFTNKKISGNKEEFMSYLLNLNGYAYIQNVNINVYSILAPTINLYTIENALQLN